LDLNDLQYHLKDQEVNPIIGSSFSYIKVLNDVTVVDEWERKKCIETIFFLMSFFKVGCILKEKEKNVIMIFTFLFFVIKIIETEIWFLYFF